jgi:hypothetical protein
VSILGSGGVRKMHASLDRPVSYALPLGGHAVPMNPLLGQVLQLEYSGEIRCIHCDRKTSKSFNQGYCYPCFKRLARCDSCIVSPEKCHFHEGTCREPEWGLANCMIDHIVYLSHTSALKVGITRGSQVPTRWIDQGATQALPLFRVDSRLHSGLLEVALAREIGDRTQWQAMLKGDGEPQDLPAAAAALLERCADDVAALQRHHGLQALSRLENAAVTTIRFPVLEYPGKVKSFNLDKTPRVGGTLLGIKGQYLIFDSGVINMRKYAGYQLTLSTTTEA